MPCSEHWKWFGLLAFVAIIYAWGMFSLLPAQWAFTSLAAAALFVLIPTALIRVGPGEGARWAAALLLMAAVSGAGVIYPLLRFGLRIM